MTAEIDPSVFDEIVRERLCENGAHPCSNQAEWIAFTRCCGRDLVVCGICKTFAEVLDHMFEGQDYLCAYCFVPFVLEPDWVRWEKL